MKTDRTHTAGADFLDLVQQARAGEATALNQFFQKLYEKGKHTLIKLTHSETLAEEYFQAAIAKFWLQCVEGNKELPATNVEGYIYRMARFYCIDQLRKQGKNPIVTTKSAVLENDKALSEEMITAIDRVEAKDLQSLRKQAIRNSLQKLSDNCQKLFQLILEDGIEKSKDMLKALGLKEVRRVSVLRHECNKRLKVLAAQELERLLQMS